MHFLLDILGGKEKSLFFQIDQKKRLNTYFMVAILL